MDKPIRPRSQKPRPETYGPGELPVEYIVRTYDNIVVGEEFGPIEFTITQQTHDKHTEMLGLDHPWFTKQSPWGGQIVWPFEHWSGPRTVSRYYGRGGGNDSVLTGIEWEFYKPFKVGEKQYGWARVHSKYFKRGKPYYKTEYWSEDKDGELHYHGFDEMMLMRELSPEQRKLRQDADKAAK